MVLVKRAISYDEWEEQRDELEDMKEAVHRLEVVKREFIQENKQIKPDRYAR